MGNQIRKSKLELEKDKKQHEIDKYLSKLHDNNRTISLLLLGAGGCGKSTIRKQMEKIYYGSLQHKILKDITYDVRQNILEDIYDLCCQNRRLKQIVIPNDTYKKPLISNGYLRAASHCLNLFIPLEIVNIICKYYYYCSVELSVKCQSICDDIASNWKWSYLNQREELTHELVENISLLWYDNGMQETFRIRQHYQTMDNSKYFFQHIHRIAQSEYVPNFDDYIRVRLRTIGIIERIFEFNNLNEKYKMKITDIGGRRSERKRWFTLFSDIDALVYVMALDGYNKFLFEDNRQNCYRETFDLFSHIIKYKIFQSIEIIVFLNKYDL
eukprot:530873_1